MSEYDALLTGRRAVVTGGTAGIGGAIVAAFATHGADVLAIDNDPRPSVEFDVAAGGAVKIVPGDVVSGDLRTVVCEYQPDILVNNVGHFHRPPQPFADDTTQQWDALHEINFGHILRLTQAVLPGMAARGGGSIINLTTVEAHRAIPGHTVYSAYKAALMQFTRSLSAEVGPDGIRVNAIAPDLIETPQVPYADIVPESEIALWRNWSPLGGPGTPADVAGAAVFLASELSRFVTGSTIHVDGGTHGSGGWVPRTAGGWTNRPRNP